MTGKVSGMILITIKWGVCYQLTTMSRSLVFGKTERKQQPMIFNATAWRFGSTYLWHCILPLTNSYIILEQDMVWWRNYPAGCGACTGYGSNSRYWSTVISIVKNGAQRRTLCYYYRARMVWCPCRPGEIERQGKPVYWLSIQPLRFSIMPQKEAHCCESVYNS